MSTWEVMAEGDRGEATRQGKRVSARIRAGRRTMDWYRGDMLTVTVRPDGAYVVSVRTTDGRLEERLRGYLEGPDAPFSYARARNDRGSAEWIGQHDGRRYVNP